MPVGQTIRDTSDMQVARFAMNAHGQLVPVNEVVLEKYTYIPLKEDVLDGETVPEPHTVWALRANNDVFGLETSLYLTAQEGFTYKTSGDEVISVSNEFERNMFESLVRAKEAGHLTPLNIDQPIRSDNI